ncbi:hypothetical protein FRB99_008145 [Tulasnella sp. 403]|nr:hypothetical protein FRB99_008145 [Tulasnella sp. 403]
MADASRMSSPSGSRPSSPAIPEESPFFVSWVHKPSTNPKWRDIDVEHEFLPEAKRLISKVNVILWAKIEDGTNLEVWKKTAPHISAKGKAKENIGHDPSWEAVLHWEVDLADAEPLPQELVDCPDRLPPNTLVVSLAPSGRWYWFPSGTLSRPSSRNGHISEGEEMHLVNEQRLESPIRESFKPVQREAKSRHTARLQDIVWLGTLESVLADTQRSTRNIQADIYQYMQDDKKAVLAREASERKLYIETLRQEHGIVTGRCDTARLQILQRRGELMQRRAMLGQARQMLETNASLIAERESLLQHDEERLRDVMSQQKALRAALVQTIDSIYPIESLSSQDLLFTILDVPLPLPNGPTDPAPPLSMPSQPLINENTTATALGYAAHVVDLVANYLGRLLPYPITYAGSRSSIKDPISAMQGPRMFPLFPTGVEKYRFEYAVFLLNKDIEILMSERDLRALDMRHTLPNLKNLLLTLSNGYSEESKQTHRTASGSRSTEDTGRLLSLDSPSADPTSASISSTSVIDPNATPRRQFLSPFAAVLKYAGPFRHAMALDESASTPPELSVGSDSLHSAEQEAPSQHDEASLSDQTDDATGSQASDNNVEEEVDDVSTERGVQLDDAEATPKETIKATNEGLTLAGVSSFFRWTSASKREVEKDDKNTASVCTVPPVHNGIP